MRLCDAGTAGVSVLENGTDGEIFRWQVLAGKLSQYAGGTAPRNGSPCGSCLDAGKPVLYARPGRRFTCFAKIQIPIVEGLVIPIYADGRGIGTIWIVSHSQEREFDAEDLRIMLSLAQFAGSSLNPIDSPMNSPEMELVSETNREVVWRSYLHRIGRNDQSALCSLFREARALVFSTALRILGFAADADEVTGDVFARLWSSGYMYDHRRGSAITWIISITRNLAFDQIRSRTRTGQSTDLLYAECGSMAEAEGSFLSAERNVFLRKALTAISFEQRRAIELAYFTGLSHSDIAEFLGEPIGTIKTRIRLGLMHLRPLLADIH